MSKLTFAKFEAAFAACIILGFCVISLVGSTILVYLGTKIYISYACATIMASPSPHHPAIANRTCEYLRDIPGDSKELLGYTLIRDSDPFGSFMTFLTCWMVLGLVVTINIPQATAAWNLLCATTLSKNTNPKATELALSWTWQHQRLQNVIIFVELLVTIMFTLVAFVLPDENSEMGEQLEWIVGIVIKVLTGRVFCAFFVEIYFHELLLAICCSRRRVLDIPPLLIEKLELDLKETEKNRSGAATNKPIPV